MSKARPKKPKKMERITSVFELIDGLSNGCGDPKCKHHHKAQDCLILSPACHPSSPLVVVSFDDGTLQFECCICRDAVMRVKVN